MALASKGRRDASAREEIALIAGINEDFAREGAPRLHTEGGDASAFFEDALAKVEPFAPHDSDFILRGPFLEDFLGHVRLKVVHHTVASRAGAGLFHVGFARPPVPVVRVAVMLADALVKLSGEAADDLPVACGVCHAEAGCSQPAEFFGGRNQDDAVPGARCLHGSHNPA